MRNSILFSLSSFFFSLAKTSKFYYENGYNLLINCYEKNNSRYLSEICVKQIKSEYRLLDATESNLLTKLDKQMIDDYHMRFLSSNISNFPTSNRHSYRSSLK